MSLYILRKEFLVFALNVSIHRAQFLGPDKKSRYAGLSILNKN